MKRVPSTEFQKSYSKLFDPVVVTALGRPIGIYLPATSEPGRGMLRGVEEAEAIRPPVEPGVVARSAAAHTSFNPVPKPGSKR